MIGLRKLPGARHLQRLLQGPSRLKLQRHGVRAMVAALGFACCANAVASGHDSVAAKAGGTVRHWLEVGEASFYALKFQGRRTANGERYDQNGLTCAHRSLPLGSWIRVTNLRNSRSIFVRVTDRGSMNSGRIVDLSLAGARAVGLQGTGKVKVESVDPGTAHALLAQRQIPPIPYVP